MHDIEAFQYRSSVSWWNVYNKIIIRWLSAHWFQANILRPLMERWIPQIPLTCVKLTVIAKYSCYKGISNFVVSLSIERVVYNITYWQFMLQQLFFVVTCGLCNSLWCSKFGRNFIGHKTKTCKLRLELFHCFNSLRDVLQLTNFMAMETCYIFLLSSLDLSKINKNCQITVLQGTRPCLQDKASTYPSIFWSLRRHTNIRKWRTFSAKLHNFPNTIKIPWDEKWRTAISFLEGWDLLRTSTCQDNQMSCGWTLHISTWMAWEM